MTDDGVRRREALEAIVIIPQGIVAYPGPLWRFAEEPEAGDVALRDRERIEDGDFDVSAIRYWSRRWPRP